MVNPKKHKTTAAKPSTYNGIDITDTKLSADEVERIAKR